MTGKNDYYYYCYYFSIFIPSDFCFNLVTFATQIVIIFLGGGEIPNEKWKMSIDFQE